MIVICCLEGYIIWSLMGQVAELRKKLSDIAKIASPPKPDVKKPVVKAQSEPSGKKKFKVKYYE